MRRHSTRNVQQKLIFFAGLVSVLLLGTVTVAAPTVYADDCGPNAIMKCGFSSVSNFIKKTRANNDANGELQKVYDHFNLEKADYDRFVSTAKSGTVYKDGRIVVGGQTVTTDAKSIGRTTLNGRHNKSMSIGKDTYYYGLTSRVFLSNSIPAKVMFDSSGNVEFAVLTDCGNPVWGENVKSSAKCNMLSSAPVSGTTDTFKFTTDAKTTGNAKITKYVYDFGDGTTKTTTSTSVTHQYKAPAKYKVKVTVYASVPGGNTITSDCETYVTVEAPVVPYYKCVDLKAPESPNLTYTFTATASFGNGATFDGGDIDFGDGKTATGLKPTTANTIVIDHTYAASSKYTATATLRFTVNGKTVTDTCKTSVSPLVPYYECVELKAPEPNGLTYTFTATARFGNGATFTGASFDFGDGKTITDVKPTTATTVSVQHTYATSNTYSASAVLHFIVNGQTVSAETCKTSVTPEGATPECKPGVPVGDARCEVCKYDSSLAADDPNCKETPTTLPNTGAGNIIAIGGVALVGGFLFYRNRSFLRHKLAFRQAQKGTSVLPLADPLNPADPLANTPLEPQSEEAVRSTLRRRRQF